MAKIVNMKDYPYHGTKSDKLFDTLTTLAFLLPLALLGSLLYLRAENQKYDEKKRLAIFYIQRSAYKASLQLKTILSEEAILILKQISQQSKFLDYKSLAFLEEIQESLDHLVKLNNQSSVQEKNQRYYHFVNMFMNEFRKAEMENIVIPSNLPLLLEEVKKLPESKEVKKLPRKKSEKKLVKKRKIIRN